jgi:hypothetical protein
MPKHKRKGEREPRTPMLSRKNPAPYHEPTATRITRQQRHYVPQWKREEERRRDEELAAENRRRRLREIRAEVARRKESREAVERAQAEAQAKPEAPLPQPSTIFTDWLPEGEIVSTLTEVEQAALTFAREQFTSFQNSSSPWSESSMLSPAAGHAWVQSVLKLGWHDVVNRLRLLMMARAGQRDAQAVLQRIILEYQTRGERMPLELEAYDMEVKTFGPAPQRPARKKASRMARDLIIMIVTMGIVDRFGLPRTKKSSSPRASASQIASMALDSVGIKMGHKAVEKILDRYRGAWPDGPGWSSIFFL